MNGVILAAGMGKRIYPLTSEVPKPILPVCNRPLAEYQLTMMRDCGLSDVYVVISQETGSIIAETLGDGSRFGLNLHYVEQKELLGTAHALGILEELIDPPLLVFLGDIYLMARDLRVLLEEVKVGRANAILVSKIEENTEFITRNFSIHEGRAGRVTKVIEKPRCPSSRIKGCGVYVFDRHVFDAVRRTPRTAMRNEYEITDSIQVMINDGLHVAHRPVVSFDLNLTFPCELLALNLMELRRRGLGKVVGRNVRIAPGASLENTVIGDESKVKHPIAIRNSVLFSGVEVDTASDIEDAIIMETQIIQCDPEQLR